MDFIDATATRRIHHDPQDGDDFLQCNEECPCPKLVLTKYGPPDVLLSAPLCHGGNADRHRIHETRRRRQARP
jgi:hypothetical protein